MYECTHTHTHTHTHSSARDAELTTSVHGPPCRDAGRCGEIQRDDARCSRHDRGVMTATPAPAPTAAPTSDPGDDRGGRAERRLGGADPQHAAVCRHGPRPLLLLGGAAADADAAADASETLEAEDGALVLQAALERTRPPPYSAALQRHSLLSQPLVLTRCSGHTAQSPSPPPRGSRPIHPQAASASARAARRHAGAGRVGQAHAATPHYGRPDRAAAADARRRQPLRHRPHPLRGGLGPVALLPGVAGRLAALEAEAAHAPLYSSERSRGLEGDTRSAAFGRTPLYSLYSQRWSSPHLPTPPHISP